MSNNEVLEFIWQYLQRKKWVTYSEEEIHVLNEAVKKNQMSVLLPNKNKRKTIAVDFEKMVQRNQASSYEQKIRCLAFNSVFFVWLWEDEYGDWQCFKPKLCLPLEIALNKKEKTLLYFDNGNYKVNFETLEQVNEDDLSTCSVKREIIDIEVQADLKKICLQNEIVFKQLCSNGSPSAKRIRIDTSGRDTQGKIILTQNSVNLQDIADTQNVIRKSPKSKNVPVDSECPEKEKFHIYCENSIIYSATLNQTNFQNNNNKFYMIQLLENNQSKQFAVWRRWGRVGYRGQTDLTKYGGSLSEAKAFFDDKFFAKTKNHWSDHKNFIHCKGKYDLLQIDFSPEENSVVKKASIAVESKLVSQLQSLLELISDKNRMEEIMKEMSYDSTKIPLGKLSKKQINYGYAALRKIEHLICGGKSYELLNACNEFYTRIPHNFGMKTPPLITTLDEVKEKMKMLEALSNIILAMGVMNSMPKEENHPLDKYYDSLNCSLEPVCPSSPEYLEIKNCLKETHGPTHANYDLELIDVFKSLKEQEQSSFINYEDKRLLWHGSRITNWFGILKDGLLIAPPEAPCSGYMFGKGIYFADVVSKSANYCCATRLKNEGVLLLCEVSVGNQFKLERSNPNLPHELPSDCNSVLGCGRYSPTDFKIGSLSSEAKVPCGPLIENTSHQGVLIYNEYVVYNVQQVKMKYLIRVKFNFK